MKLLIFTEGTILMHKNAVGLAREEIIKQVQNKEESVKDYASYIPIGDASEKIAQWVAEGNEIIYLTSRRKPEEIGAIRGVLRKYNFPSGDLEFRKNEESYVDVAERVKPDVIIEDDCESIGEESEMIYPNMKEGSRAHIRSVVIKEFSGIDIEEI